MDYYHACGVFKGLLLLSAGTLSPPMKSNFLFPHKTSFLKIRVWLFVGGKLPSEVYVWS